MTNPTPLRRIGESYFKPVEGGYLVETPSPWLFAPGRRYVVTDDQKRALLDIMAQRWKLPVGWIAAAVVGFAVGVSLLWWKLSPRSTPGPYDLFGMTVTIVLPLYVVAVIAIRRYLADIAPIVSSAAPTKARLTVGERYRAIGDAMSTKVLVACLVLWVIAAVMSLIAILLDGNASRSFGEQRSFLSILQIVLSTAFALWCAYTLHRRFRRTK